MHFRCACIFQLVNSTIEFIRQPYFSLGFCVNLVHALLWSSGIWLTNRVFPPWAKSYTGATSLAIARWKNMQLQIPRGRTSNCFDVNWNRGTPSCGGNQCGTLKVAFANQKKPRYLIKVLECVLNIIVNIWINSLQGPNIVLVLLGTLSQSRPNPLITKISSARKEPECTNSLGVSWRWCHKQARE